MASKQEEKLLSGVAPFLDPDERAMNAIVAQARGRSRRVTAFQVDLTGQEQKSNAAAKDAEVQLASRMGLVLTDRRVLTVEISAPIGMGHGGDVKGVMSSIPLDDVDSIVTKRAGIGKKVMLTVRGTQIDLECNASANAQDLAESFLQVKQQ